MILFEPYIKIVPLFGISGGEIILVILLVLLLFGPKKIPEIARTLGKGINEVKKIQRDINTEINQYSQQMESPVKDINKDIEAFKKGLSQQEDPSNSNSGIDQDKEEHTDKAKNASNDPNDNKEDSANTNNSADNLKA